jgi:hypothetical protein
MRGGRSTSTESPSTPRSPPPAAQAALDEWCAGGASPMQKEWAKIRTLNAGFLMHLRESSASEWASQRQSVDAEVDDKSVYAATARSSQKSLCAASSRWSSERSLSDIGEAPAGDDGTLAADNTRVPPTVSTATSVATADTERSLVMKVSRLFNWLPTRRASTAKPPPAQAPTPESAPRPKHKLHERAVSVRWLKAFIAEYPQMLDYYTWEVVLKVVMPATKRHLNRYCELPGVELGAAEVFGARGRL